MNETIVIMRLLWILCLAVLVSFCTQQKTDIPEEFKSLENLVVIPGDSQPLRIMEPKRSTSFGDNEDVIFGRISSTAIAIDDEGNTYIGDSIKNTIHIFTADGIYNGSIGREGDGPGEFRGIAAVKVYGHQIYVMDSRSYRITVFDISSKEIVESFNIPFTAELVSGTVAIPGNFHLTPDRNHILIVFDIAYMASESEDTGDPVLFGKLFNINTLTFEDGRVYEVPPRESVIHRDGSGRMVIFTPEYKRNSHILFSDNLILSAWNEHLLFKFHDYNGNYKKALYYPVSKMSIDKNEILRSYDGRGELSERLIRNDNMPDFYPAFKHAITDDENRLWVALYTEKLDYVNWKALTPTGELFSSFIWPTIRSIVKIKDGFIYTLETDDETGIQEVVKYSFTR